MKICTPSVIFDLNRFQSSSTEYIILFCTILSAIAEMNWRKPCQSVCDTVEFGTMIVVC